MTSVLPSEVISALIARQVVADLEAVGKRTDSGILGMSIGIEIGLRLAFARPEWARAVERGFGEDPGLDAYFQEWVNMAPQRGEELERRL